MGEMADMMLTGVLCHRCGCYLEKSLGDFPQLCEDCKKDEDPPQDTKGDE